jgi:3-hydroxy-D-aspartate aldolase
MQLRTGSVGICTAKLGEAEVMLEHGIDRVLMTTSSVTPFKIERAMRLRSWSPGFIQATDTQANARDLSAAALAAGVTAEVVIDVGTAGGRTRNTPRQPPLALAQHVDQQPRLRLMGRLC